MKECIEMTNLAKLRTKEHFTDLEKNPNDDLLKIFTDATFDPLFSQVFELAGYKPTDITTRTVFVGRHAKDSVKAMARHLISTIYHVKRGLKSKNVDIIQKVAFIDHFLGEFGNVSKKDFYGEIAHLSSPEEVDKARVAFEVAAYYVNNGEYGSAIQNGIVDFLNILTNSLKLAETEEFLSIDLIDLVEMSIFDTHDALLKMMADTSYTHKAYCMKIWVDIFNNSPYLLWININETGVVRAYNMLDCIGLYRVHFESDIFDSRDLRLKRCTIFGELNAAYGTSDTVVPATKPKKFNKATAYFKKKGKHLKYQARKAENCTQAVVA